MRMNGRSSNQDENKKGEKEVGNTEHKVIKRNQERKRGKNNYSSPFSFNVINSEEDRLTYVVPC